MRLFEDVQHVFKAYSYYSTEIDVKKCRSLKKLHCSYNKLIEYPKTPSKTLIYTESGALTKLLNK